MGLNFNADGIVKGFFGGNAYLAILFLLFICLFLWKSGMGFIPSYKRELSDARVTGIEVSNKLKYELDGYDALASRIAQAYSLEKRERFGDKEMLVFVYEEFEGLLDDELEGDIDEFTDLDDDQKEAAKASLAKKIEELCIAVSQQDLLKVVKPRLPETTQIPLSIIENATEAAKIYAFNDYETPESISNIPLIINKEMGEMGSIVKELSKASDNLKSLHKEVEDIAFVGFDQLVKNYQNQSSVDTLTEGLKLQQKLVDASTGEAKVNAEAIVSGTRHKIETAKNKIQPVDTETPIKAVYQSLQKHKDMNKKLQSEIPKLLNKLQSITLKSPKAQEKVASVSDLLPDYIAILHEQQVDIAVWRHDEEVGLGIALKAFFLGTDWKTGSNRQSLYGILPLFAGSLLISAVAMLFAVPLAIGAAVYVNQFAGKREAGLLKPSIEFIQAIPSVVLGLFGVLVVGGLLKDLSASPLLEWIPGFPITDRLNVLLAGILLAFMASPTIFTLAEDALNNVPKAFSEASLAMGATKLQTAIKVILPAALSGIIAAIMLGFGRVIGETMVVLLVAGNKAKMPELTEGIGVLGQPVHTMTGIIAQEYGEAAQGSTLYQSLFMVGLVLFTISLIINTACQRVLARQRK